MTIRTLTDLSAKLVELESHPGREHLRRYSPVGATAQRWAVVDAMLGRLWDDLADQTDDFEQANAAYPAIVELLDAVDTVDTAVVKQLAPLLAQIDAAGAAVPKDITDLLAVSASDPLSLTTEDIDRRITVISEVVAFEVNWPSAVADTAERLDALRDAILDAANTRASATKKVLTGPLPVADDTEPKLRAELDSMTAPNPTALRDLRRRIESALQRARRNKALAQGLLDRRTELKGRLKAYQAKAARLGLAEDTELLSARGRAAGLLSRQPCDLRHATQALVDYQQLVSAKREKTR
jgi:hypothetical protein